MKVVKQIRQAIKSLKGHHEKELARYREDYARLLAELDEIHASYKPRLKRLSDARTAERERATNAESTVARLRCRIADLRTELDEVSRARDAALEDARCARAELESDKARVRRFLVNLTRRRESHGRL